MSHCPLQPSVILPSFWGHVLYRQWRRSPRWIGGVCHAYCWSHVVLHVVLLLPPSLTVHIAGLLWNELTCRACCPHWPCSPVTGWACCGRLMRCTRYNKCEMLMQWERVRLQSDPAIRWQLLLFWSRLHKRLHVLLPNDWRRSSVRRRFDAILHLRRWHEPRQLCWSG